MIFNLIILRKGKKNDKLEITNEKWERKGKRKEKDRKEQDKKREEDKERDVSLHPFTQNNWFNLGKL